MSQEALAFDAGVDRSSISYIENATVSASLDLLDRLADALCVDIGELFKEPQAGDKMPEALKRGRRSTRQQR